MSITEDPQSYIESKYLPSDVLLKEPSKMGGVQVTQILEFWRRRQQIDPEDVFRFVAWKDSEGALQRLVGEDEHWSDKALGKRRRQGEQISLNCGVSTKKIT